MDSSYGRLSVNMQAWYNYMVQLSSAYYIFKTDAEEHATQVDQKVIGPYCGVIARR